MEAKVTTLPELVCKYNTSYQPKMITENMICAENGGKDSCWGDSGGEINYFNSGILCSLSNQKVHFQAKILTNWNSCFS